MKWNGHLKPEEASNRGRKNVPDGQKRNGNEVYCERWRYDDY